MRKLILIASLLLALPLVALAQDQPKVEIFGGYSYLNPNDDDDLHGWNASVTGNLNKWFGLKADFSGYYESYDGIAGSKIKVRNYFFMSGGQFAYRKSDRIQPFAHVMAGTVLLRLKQKNIPCPATVLGCVNSFSASDTGFAMMFGGGVDLKIAKSLAARLIQADYVLVRNEGETGHGFRLSTGLVYRIGDH